MLPGKSNNSLYVCDELALHGGGNIQRESNDLRYDVHTSTCY